MKKLLLVAGARPNFMKIAPLTAALAAHADEFASCLVHTGQHYDAALSQVFFDELGIPRPDRNLGVGSGSHARQTAQVMIGLEEVLLEEEPAAIVVVGDVNSTVAGALVAAKLGVPVVHVEAGLRSGDRSMPEEINRIVTDSISDLLLVSEESGLEHLAREGIPAAKVRFVGNLMIDTLLRHREAAEASRVREGLGLERHGYAVLTLHRPSNVDDPEVLRRIFGALRAIAERLPIVFPLHPRTLHRVEQLGLLGELDSIESLRRVEPLGYLDFLKLQADARLVLTDSGGIQEEATVLEVPCITLRENTERPVTLAFGNVLVGSDPERILAATRAVLDGERERPPGRPRGWDGEAGPRVVEALRSLV